MKFSYTVLLYYYQFIKFFHVPFEQFIHKHPIWIITAYILLCFSNVSYNKNMTSTNIEHAISNIITNFFPGPDYNHTTMVKNLHPDAIDCLTYFLSELFSTESYPTLWKIVIIIPILKLIDPFKLQSHRLISLTSIFGKILEKIINQWLTWFLESNNILSNYQYGFRKTRSTLHALCDLVLNIRTVSSIRFSVYTIFFNFEKT